MAKTKPTKKGTRKSTKSTGESGRASKGLTAEEKAAMRETIRERESPGGEKEVLSKIAEMSGSDRAMAKRIHRIVTETAPDLTPRTWYGMPAYANKDGKVVCFFQDAQKFKARYATFGFNDAAKLDKDAMWPTSFALKKVTAAEEKKIAALVKKAVS
jgi:uncharacterized protein YdhG (YjbR/CyaY superfamily)